MTSILVPIDGLQDNARLVARVVELCRQGPTEVHLLSVQTAFNAHVAMFFAAAELRAFHDEDARRELAPVERLLDEAGVPFTSHVQVGRHADTISRVAQELRCRHILMQERPANPLSRLVMGSLADQVQHLVAGTSTACDVI